MKKVVLFVEEMYDDGDGTFATLYQGVMDDEFIYAEKTSCSCKEAPEYIQVSINDTIDCTDDVKGLKPGRVSRSIELSSDKKFEDSRIKKVHKFSQEIQAELEARNNE